MLSTSSGCNLFQFVQPSEIHHHDVRLESLDSRYPLNTITGFTAYLPVLPSPTTGGVAAEWWDHHRRSGLSSYTCTSLSNAFGNPTRQPQQNNLLWDFRTAPMKCGHIWPGGQYSKLPIQ